MEVLADAWDATREWSHWDSTREWLTLLILAIAAFGAVRAALKTGEAAGASARSAEASATLARAAMSEHAPQLQLDVLPRESGNIYVQLQNYGLGPAVYTTLRAEMTLSGSYSATEIEEHSLGTLPAGGGALTLTVYLPSDWAMRTRVEPDDESTDLFTIMAQVNGPDGSLLAISCIGIPVLAEPPEFNFTLIAESQSVMPEADPSTAKVAWSGTVRPQPPRFSELSIDDA
jgi:hypothetical protein